MDLSIVVRLANVKLWRRKPGPCLTAVAQALLYEAESVRRLKGLRLSEPMPDESNILHFRHLLERRQNRDRDCLRSSGPTSRARGMILKEGTIVYAIIIQAPASTKTFTRNRGAIGSQTSIR